MRLIVLRRKYCAEVFLCVLVTFTLLPISDIFRDNRETFFPVTNKVIFIDAGHGGRDPGAVGKLGKTEEKINLDIALKLKRMVEEGGGIAIVFERE